VRGWVHLAWGGEGTLFGSDARWSEPLTALPRSARSWVSSGARLDAACEDTLTSPTQSVNGARTTVNFSSIP